MSLERLTEVAVDTDLGLKTVELFCGDLTDFAFGMDVLCISAFLGDYAPIRGTAIGSLRSKWGVSVQDLKQSCMLDLTESLGIWISSPLASAKVKRLICVETSGDISDSDDVLENLFVGIAILEAKGADVRTVAMPLLTAGNMRLPADEVASKLVALADQALRRSARVERLLFIELDPIRARTISEAIDRGLGRMRAILPRKPVVDGIKRDIIAELSNAEAILPEGHERLVQEIKAALGQKAVRASELGVISRRSVEFIVNDLLGENKTSPDILVRIDKLAELGVASWIRSYMHLLRTLGNEAAHEKSTVGIVPSTVADSDLTISLFCLQRLWRFWMEWRSGPAID